MTTNLQLGDIILIKSKTNPNINDKIFFIEYISNKRIQLKNTETLDVQQLYIENNKLLNESIDEIDILSRAEEPGYARQNGLLPGKWILIYISGDLPQIINGKIIDLDEDMIEVETYPNKEHIWIDFEYQGLPENIPIESIKIRDTPSQDSIDKLSPIKETITQDDSKSSYEESASKSPEKEESLESLESLESPESPEEIQIEEIEKPVEIDNKLKEFIIEADNIEFGDDLGEIVQEVELSEDKMRYDLNSQLEDMLDDLLSHIPSSEQTKKVMDDISQELERFQELRKKFSIIDEFGSINGIVKTIKEQKPLLDKLIPWQKQLKWLIPVIENKKILYDIDQTTFENEYDIINKNLATVLSEELAIYDEYLNSNQPNDLNRLNKLYNKLERYYVPHEPIQEKNNLNIEFQNNQQVIIDTLGDLNSFVAKNDQVIKSQQVFDKYTLPIKGFQNNINEYEYDYGSLKSIILLDLHSLNSQNSYTLGNTILDKVNYSQFYLFKHLDKQPIPLIVDDTFNQPHEFNETIEYINTDISLYKLFDLVLPNTTQLLNILEKKYHGPLTLYNYIQLLNVFDIKKENINNKDADIINNLINTKLNIYDNEIEHSYKNLVKMFSFDTNKIYDNTLINIFSGPNAEYKNILTESYPFTADKNSIEILNNILSLDGGRLFNLLITLQSLDLYVNQDLEKLVIQEMEKDNEPEKINNCSEMSLAKKYIDEVDLVNDNNTTIYFDKDLDPTQYDIIMSYDKDRLEMNAIKFKQFLIDKLESTIGLTREKAIRDAEAMIETRRKIVDGDYAVLVVNNNYKYYVRKDNIWQLDSNIPNISIENNETFCNLKAKCLFLNNECDTIENKQLSLTNLITIFDKKHEIKRNNLDDFLHSEILYASYFCQKKKVIEINSLYNITKAQFNSGLDFIQEKGIQSPFNKLMDKILSVDDFVKRQEDIITFANKYTRTAIHGEDPAWLYCIETNIKLMPKFFSHLAEVWINNGPYLLELEKVCKEQGVISNDGDCWVDIHSGYTIKRIDFDTDEGYEQSGFKKVSKEVLEESASKILLDAPKKIDIAQSKEEIIVNRIIKAIEKFLGVVLDNYYKLITSLAINKHKIVLPTKEQYENKTAILKKKGKKVPSYNDIEIQSLMLFTLTAIAFSIVTARPSITTKKTFPGCKRSFDGFPVTGKENISAITYIACIAKKISSQTEPWNSISKFSEKKIIERIVLNLEKFYINDKEIENEIELKIKYLNENTLEIIPNELSIQQWTQFLPPLGKIKNTMISSIGPAFKSTLKQSLKTGNKKQQEMINELLSKPFYLAQNMLDIVNNIIEKEEALLVNSLGEPFLENSCCIGMENYALDYFIGKNNKLNIIIEKAKEYEVIIEDIQQLTRAATQICLIDTKLNYPETPKTFNEEIIYRIVIKYCNYDSYKPIPNELKDICLTKPENYRQNDTIHEKIKYLKSIGRTYTHETLITILKLNSIPIIYNQDTPTNNLTDLLEVDYNNIIYNRLREVSKYFAEDIKEYPEEVKLLINELTNNNNQIKGHIKKLIREKSSQPKSIKNKVITFLDDLVNWTPMSNKINEDTERNNYNRKLQFLKNYSYQLSSVYPNIILNHIDQSNAYIPDYWNLSEKHTIYIKELIRNYYKPLQKYQNIEGFRKVLSGLDVYLLEELSKQIVVKNNKDSVFSDMIVMIIMEAIILDIYNQLIQQAELDTTDIIVDLQEELVQDTLGTTTEFIIDTLLLMTNEKKLINKSYEQVEYEINKSKEKEKDKITERLKNLTEEERIIDSEFKKSKLGVWNTGLQKGLTEYDPEFYDKEKEKESDMSVDEKEALSMSHIPDDDDYGDLDGDEFY